MTASMSTKLFFLAALMSVMALPALTHADTMPVSSLSSLQSHYQMLMERFEVLKGQRGGAMGSSTHPRGPKASSTVDRNCMAAAVATREAAIKTAWGTFNSAITAGLDTRATSLANAWNSSETGSRSAITAAWSKWKKDSLAANTKLRTERRNAWEAFKKTAKESCKVTTPTEEGLEKAKTDSIVL